jgi:hypothetical protein
LLALSLVMLSTSACVVRAYPGVPANAEIVVAAPPPPQVEAVSVAPSANHVWIRGHWAWRGAWVWEPGYWELVRPGHVWVEGHWMRHRHGWVWVGGRWNRV